MHMFRPVYFILALIFFAQVAVAQTAMSIKDWPMPAGTQSGLVNPGFKLVPSFIIENRGTKTYLILKMGVALATPRNQVAPYTYRYMREGKVYNDKDLGQDPFNPISLASATFSVLVQGPGVYKLVDYEWFRGRNEIGEVPSDTKPDSYTASVQGLTAVSYNGTDAINKAITGFDASLRKRDEEIREVEIAKEQADKKEAEKRKLEEDEKRRFDEIEKKKAEDEKKRLDDIERKKAEDEKKRLDDIEKKKAEDEKKRLDDIEKKKIEDDKAKSLLNNTKAEQPKVDQSVSAEKKQEKAVPIPEKTTVPVDETRNQINETEVKAYYLLAEENYLKSSFLPALNFLKNAKATLGGANCKILYLQIKIENELAKTRKNYKDSLIKTITAFQASPDIKYFNEDKILEVVKMKLELMQKLAEEAAILAEKKAVEDAKNDKSFKDYAFIAGVKVGITVKEAERLYPAFFRKTKTEVSLDYPGLEVITAKPVEMSTYISVASVFVKGNIIVGNRFMIEYPEGDSKRNNYEGFKKFILNEREANSKLFGFEPENISSGDGYGYKWVKNKKTVIRNWKNVTRKGDGFYGIFLSDIVDESY